MFLGTDIPGAIAVVLILSLYIWAQFGSEA